jgi:hypothetical protein
MIRTDAPGARDGMMMMMMMMMKRMTLAGTMTVLATMTMTMTMTMTTVTATVKMTIAPIPATIVVARDVMTTEMIREVTPGTTVVTMGAQVRVETRARKSSVTVNRGGQRELSLPSRTQPSR